MHVATAGIGFLVLVYVGWKYGLGAVIWAAVGAALIGVSTGVFATLGSALVGIISAIASVANSIGSSL